MTGSNLLTTTIDPSSGYINNYLKPGQNISQNINDALIGYFERIADDKTSARAMAGAVISTATAQGINPVQLLESFKNLGQKELNDFVIKFLNYQRVETSYLGVSTRKVENKYVKRLIRP